MRDHGADLGRREVLQRLAMGVGGLLTFPLVSPAHPIQQHLHDVAAIGLADAKAQAAGYTPEFLDAHQMETLRLLAETIVPGSTKASSAEFIDQLLTVSAVDDQKEFLQALGGLEGLAITRAGGPWKSLSEQQQRDLLTFASTEKPGVPQDPKRPTPGPHVTIRDHFDHLKGWVVGAYYSSEIGMRELGWTGNVVFPAFPGCEHTAGHA